MVLVGIGLLFEMQQAGRQQATEKQQQELAEQRAQDEALQAYLNQMSQLMQERKLLEAEPGDPVHTLAQARTSTVIFSLDAEHNESVTRFLINSGLAVRSKASALPAVTAFASHAPPEVSAPPEASARLLREITLSHATLSDAYLPNADLTYADLSGANIFSANLRWAILPDADLSGADLRRAFLSDAILERADLSGANLKEANLSVAWFDGADLSGAYLGRAEGITNEELDQQAASLEGATMPDGQKYEDWLKSKDRREDG